MPMQEFGKPQQITDFVDAIKILEIKNRDYLFTFVNGFTGNTYVFRIYKEVFDKMMEKRAVVDMKVNVFDSDKHINEIKEEVNKMVS